MSHAHPSHAPALCSIKYQTVEELRDRDYLAKRNAAETLLSDIHRDSIKAVGSQFPREWLRQLNASVLSPNSTWSKISNVMSLTNFVWVFSIILLIIASHRILLNLTFAFYQLFTNIPVTVAENFFYLLCFSFVVAGVRLGIDLGTNVALTGLIGLIPSFLFTGKLHTSKGDGNIFAMVMFVYLTITWGITAAAFQSHLMALGAVIALTVFLYLIEASSFICYALNIYDWKLLRYSFNAFFVLAASIVFSIWFPSSLVGRVFAPSGLYIGALGYLTGTYCGSCTRYNQNPDVYLFTQMLMVGSGFVTLMVGFTTGLYPLTSISGTFLILWLLAKHLEYPWGQQRWTLGLFTFALLLYIISFVIRSYPQLFVLVLIH
eukprot:TRINITY_DN6578_c0_g1_i1.p1 TRINITY_DN6578_c0_g1~~TRINITY_DN6578_c0_g1_i1.p1  ORF type:complete len:376 (-),score=31.97 TRINITY_DN6578_c0_g1_i1:51-1178(-)